MMHHTNTNAMEALSKPKSELSRLNTWYVYGDEAVVSTDNIQHNGKTHGTGFDTG